MSVTAGKSRFWYGLPDPEIEGVNGYTLIADAMYWLMARRNEDGKRFFVLVDDGKITGIVPEKSGSFGKYRARCDLAEEIKV